MLNNVFKGIYEGLGKWSNWNRKAAFLCCTTVVGKQTKGVEVK